MTAETSHAELLKRYRAQPHMTIDFVKEER